MSKNNFDVSKLNPASLENALKLAETRLGVDKEKLNRLSSPAELSKMLRQLSEDDMAKLELVLKNPKSLERLMTPENTAKLKGIIDKLD